MSIKPKLTTFDATMIVVSLVIGIGIFRTPAIVASTTGTTTLFLTAWLLGGIFSFFGALTFAEIGSRFTRPGAYYKVVADCYHPAAAFMLNWANVIIVNTAGSAAVAIIGAEYLTPILFPPDLQTSLTTQLVASGLTVFLLTINYLGIKTGAWAQNIFTIIKIGMMAAIVIAALFFGNHPSIIPAPITISHPWWMALALGLISVYYTYGGYQNTLNFGGDVKMAQRNIPRAIFFGIAIIISLYIIINLAYLHVLGIDGVAGAKLVAAEVSRVCFGESAFTLVSVTIFLSAMGFLNVTLMQIPRTYYAMAEDGALPAIFMKVNEKTQAQEFTLLFFGGMILFSIFLLGTFEKLINYVMFFDNLNNAIVASTIFVLRRHVLNKDIFEGYQIPFYPILPAIFVLFLLSISLSVLLTQQKDTYIGLGILLVGYPIYYLMKRFSAKHVQS
jgi:APA family basic amino acid/polyamine antiporter